MVQVHIDKKNKLFRDGFHERIILVHGKMEERICLLELRSNHQPISDQIIDGPCSHGPKLLLWENPREIIVFFI